MDEKKLYYCGIDNVNISFQTSTSTIYQHHLLPVRTNYIVSYILIWKYFYDELKNFSHISSMQVKQLSNWLYRFHNEEPKMNSW